MRDCPVCRSIFPNFLPLPTAYFQSASRLGVTYSFEDFETLNVGQYNCPNCFATDRDRLYALFVEHVLKPSDGLRVLEIAPAEGLSRYLRALPGVQYRSADLFSPSAMDKVDIMNMSCYPDGMFDFIVCSHVLEHVRDDRLALRELWRVLAPGGQAILMVPILTTATDTDEDPDEKDPAQRERRFGQDDHVRMYARENFLARVSEAGFDVLAMDQATLVAASGQSSVFDQHGVSSRSVLYVGHKPVAPVFAAAIPSERSGAPQVPTAESWNLEPEVTVAIPAYKAEFLGAALDSALAQTYTDFEILVCDDSPGTEVEEIVRSRQGGPVALRYLRNPSNLGEGGNVRRCMDEARGRYLKLLFDDDLLAPDCLSRMVAVLKKHQNVAIVGSRRHVIDQQGQQLASPHSLAYLFPFPGDVQLEGRTLVSFLGDNTVNFIGEPSTVMCRTEDARRAAPGHVYVLGGKRIDWIGDLSLYVKLLQLGDLALLAQPLSSFRISAAQTSQHARDDSDLGKDAHALFRSKLRELGWYQGPCSLKVRKLHENGSFESFDLRAFWRSQLQGTPEATAGREFSYDRWAHQRTPSSRPELIQRQLHLSVWVFASSQAAPALEVTLSSLAAQWRTADAQVVYASGQSMVDSSDGPGWILLLAAGDELEPDALYEIERRLLMTDTASALLISFDHDERDEDGYRSKPSFKPAYNLELLLSSPYHGRVVAVRSDLLAAHATPFLPAPWPLVYSLCLQAIREGGAGGIVHLPRVLVHVSSAMVAAWPHQTAEWQSLAEVLRDHVELVAPDSQMLEGPGPGTFHVVPRLPATPKVSVIIPTRDQLPFLSRCIESLLGKTNYPDFEIIVVDNDSQTPEAQAFLIGLEQVDPNRIRVLRVPGPFNFSRMNNLAVAQARGEFILLLNNDTAVLQADWLSHMMRHALRDGVGIVGARLVYPEGTVQHAGVIMGLRGPADHPCLGLKPDEPGYMFRAQLTQNFSAVTAACMLVSKAVYEEVGGLDEVDFAVSYNDVDFCLKVGQTGRRIVWTPLATLLHEGSASQKASIENLSAANKAARFTKEQAAMYRKWPDIIANDPAYNPNLSLVERGYEVETNPLLCFDPLRDFYEHKVVAFAADAMGCGNYRILQPMQAMLKDDLCLGGTSPEIFGPNLALRSRADVLVFQRPTDDRGIQTLEALIPLKGVKKIFEVDDNLTRVPVKSAHFAHMPKDTRGRMLKSMGLCDRLVVSTEPLAHEFKNANGDVRVVPNRLPPAMWGQRAPLRDPQARQGRKPVVAWAGGAGHRGDLEMVAQLIKDLAGQVEWEFFGMCPDMLQPYVKRVHTGVPTLEYPAQLMALSQNWDLAIAPLEVNAFNESKSNLRLLEYGWCGLPVVCSDVTPYQGDLPVTRVKNRHKDWKNAVLERLADLPAAQQQGLALQAEIEANWVLQGQHVVDWYKAWTD